jgi:predicted PurR-regulated permease PerM
LRSTNGPLTERGLLRALLLVGMAFFGLFVAWRFLTAIASIVLLLSTGVLLAVVLSAPVEALHQRKVPRSVACGLVAAGTSLLLGLGGYLLLPVLEEQASLLASALPGAFSRLEEQVENLAGGLGLELEGAAPSPSTLADWGRGLVGGALGLFGTLSFAVLGVLVVVFLAFYLAAIPGPVIGWMVRLFPPEHRPRARDVLIEIRSGLLDWLKGRLLSMAIIGVLSTGALYLIGVPGALFLGIFAGLVEFVPYVGPIVSAIPPVLLALVADPADALWVLLAYIIIQQLESYLVTPLIMEETASLHPAAVIAAIAVGGGAFGIMGALLALPMAVVAGILVEELWFRHLEEDPKAREQSSRATTR